MATSGKTAIEGREEAERHIRRQSFADAEVIRLAVGRLAEVLDWLGEQAGDGLETAVRFDPWSDDDDACLEVVAWWCREGFGDVSLRTFCVRVGASKTRMMAVARLILDVYRQASRTAAE
ncbi:MAG: hypothetical protein BGO49_25250 [Planctomycetales bacterium 71-10]|nr:MAG: hypothetical protein BGO49_25250 [Planctomycetales bacterium 71-10]